MAEEDVAEALIDAPIKFVEPKIVPDLLGVVEMLYHRVHGIDTKGVEKRFSRSLQTKEQLYQRNCVVGEDWIALDLGWIKEPGMIHVANSEKLPKKTLFVSFTQSRAASWKILSGETFRGTPSGDLFICSEQGPVACCITVWPN